MIKLRDITLFLSCLFTVGLTMTWHKEMEECERSDTQNYIKETMPTYIINLDLPPEERWKELITNKKNKIAAVTSYVESLVRYAFGDKVYSIIDRNLLKVAASLPSPYREEIQGIAKYSDLPVSYITLYNIFYEAVSLCTSIVTQSKDGRIYLGRNLDTGVFLGWDSKNTTWRVSEMLRPLTVQLEWRKENATVFKSINFAGFIGVLTAMKENNFSLSVNRRFAVDGGFMGLLEWILFDDHKQKWVTFLTREVMEEANMFYGARAQLANSRLLAPVYYILAGTKRGEGAIVTRDRENKDIFTLLSKLDGCGSWFLVQTNYDHWFNPPFFDDRRGPAVQCLMKAGRYHTSFKLISSILSTKPILNKETVYSAFMDASRGTLEAWITTCPDPCPLWG
ncbi:acid ceramidase-like [Oratosquilla oratoria]|uniref:acid ceramidase-like n=1 Tax=Oratosquilla oratoria TaxID=337810 RepID=UPI003F774F30